MNTESLLENSESEFTLHWVALPGVHGCYW